MHGLRRLDFGDIEISDAGLATLKSMHVIVDLHPYTAIHSEPVNL